MIWCVDWASVWSFQTRDRSLLQLMSDVVVAQGLTKRYGALEAVKGISFTIPQGLCVGFLGPNGAGKSSTIRMISCLSPITSGTLTVFGEAAGISRSQIKARIGVVAQEDTLDPDLSLIENLLIYARYFGISPHRATGRAEELLAFMQLADRKRDQVRELSGGMRRRLVIARALMHRPELLILDEPTTGLDPQARLLVWESLRQLKGEGVTILLTTHYMEEASRLSDTALVIDHGRILAAGTPLELIEREVGAEAMEIAQPQADDAALLEHLGAAVRRHDRQGELLVVYAANSGDLTARVAELAVRPRQLLIRPTHLEDVFLTLTGRGLRE